MSTNDLKRAAASGVVWNLFQNLVGRLLGFVVMALLARFLDEAAFGAVAIALSVTALAELLINQGYGDFVAQHAQLTDEHLDTSFWLNLGGATVLTLLLLILAPPIASSLEAPELDGVIRLLSPMLVLRALSVVPNGILVREMRFRSLSLRSVVAAVFGGIAAGAAAIAGLGLYSLVVQILAAEISGTLLLWGAARWRPGVRVSRAAFREITRFGSPLFAAGLLSFASRRLDAAVIGAALGIPQLGFYTLAQRTYQTSTQIVNKSADAVAFSALARLAQDHERRAMALVRAAELTAVICFPLYAGMAIVADDLVLVLFGVKWLASGGVLMFFSLVGLVGALSFLHTAALKAVAHTRPFLVMQVVMAVVYLALLSLLVSHGIVAAAAAYLLACCLLLPLEIWLVIRAYELHAASYLRALAPIAAATAIMAAVTMVAKLALEPLPPLPALLAEIAIGAVSFTMSLRTLARSMFDRTIDELRQIVRGKGRSDRA
jgi:O-antigen/teichoic acid export membrane protein